MCSSDLSNVITFETQEMMEDTLILLRFNCPDPDCDYIGNGWGDLKLHVRATHGKLMWFVSGPVDFLNLTDLYKVSFVFEARRFLHMNMRYIHLICCPFISRLCTIAQERPH